MLKPGDTVILGNLNAHKVFGVREGIEAVGARILYLPPYSPDFNLIEQVFAKIKALLRTAAARTAAELIRAIPDAFTAVRPDECRNYLTAAGTMPLNQPERDGSSDMAAEDSFGFRNRRRRDAGFLTATTA